MKKFIFAPEKILKKGYTYYNSKAQIMGILWSDVIKVGILVTAFTISGFFYLKYVNLASTKGYFLRQANNRLDVAKFNYEILKMKILEYEKETRSTLDFPTVQAPLEVVTIVKKQ